MWRAAATRRASAAAHTANGTGWSAGIGGGDDNQTVGGDVAVYGGKVTANGGHAQPGIGGNCTGGSVTINGGAVTATAAEAIKITAITFDALGAPVLTYPASYGNGQVVLQGSANIGASASWHDGKQSGEKFFKTVLRLK